MGGYRRAENSAPGRRQVLSRIVRLSADDERHDWLLEYQRLTPRWPS